MRWETEPRQYPNGARRVVRRFLLLPASLPVAEGSNERETRWLEVAGVHQRYAHGLIYDGAWFDVSWAEPESETP